MAIKSKQTSRKKVDKAVGEADSKKEETRGITLRLPLAKHTKFKVKCAKNQETMTDVIYRSIDDYLRRKM